MRTNAVKAKLSAGEAVFGCFLRYPDPGLVEMLGYHDWDFLVFDGEHGTLEPRDCENLVRAAELREVTPIVRVPTNQPSVILRYMDTGAQGLHVPWVNTAAAAREVVRAVKYHPMGSRGLARVRAADYGLTAPLSEYIQRANAETLVVVHIETSQAVDKLDEILAVEGLDVIFIGPNDLSHSLGAPGQIEHPEVQAALHRIVEAVGEAEVALGMMVNDARAAQAWQERGARYIATSLESILSPAVLDYLSNARV